MKNQTNKPSIKSISIGDTIDVDVFKPEEGRGTFPIGRWNGIICKLIIPKELGWIEYDCTVRATVAVKENKYIRVVVEQVIRTASTNEAELSLAIKDMKSNFGTRERKQSLKKGVNDFSFRNEYLYGKDSTD